MLVGSQIPKGVLPTVSNIKKPILFLLLLIYSRHNCS